MIAIFGIKLSDINAAAVSVKETNYYQPESEREQYQDIKSTKGDHLKCK